MTIEKCLRDGIKRFRIFQQLYITRGCQRPVEERSIQYPVHRNIPVTTKWIECYQMLPHIIPVIYWQVKDGIKCFRIFQRKFFVSCSSYRLTKIRIPPVPLLLLLWFEVTQDQTDGADNLPLVSFGLAGFGSHWERQDACTNITKRTVAEDIG